MGDEPVPHLSPANDDTSVRQRRPEHPDLKGWAFTCMYCDTSTTVTNDEDLNEISQGRIVSKSDYYNVVPDRCSQCRADKYYWLTMKKLKQEVKAAIKNRYKVTMAVFTLGKAVIVDDPHKADAESITLRRLAKQKFGDFIRSKWWRNRVDGALYTIEVKETPLPDGRIKLHPHLHVIMEHQGYENWKEAAHKRGLGEYTNAKRIRPTKSYKTMTQALDASIGYVVKYMMKGYGDPNLKGRYYERTGTFRNRKK